jgi:hypothetical protein
LSKASRKIRSFLYTLRSQAETLLTAYSTDGHFNRFDAHCLLTRSYLDLLEQSNAAAVFECESHSIVDLDSLQQQKESLIAMAQAKDTVSKLNLEVQQTESLIYTTGNEIIKFNNLVKKKTSDFNNKDKKDKESLEEWTLKRQRCLPEDETGLNNNITGIENLRKQNQEE